MILESGHGEDPDFDPQEVARNLFDELSYTAAVRDLDAHAACMSKRLVISGIPNVGAIDYDGWLLRRRNELRKPLLYSLTYRDLSIAEATEQEINGTVHEILKGMEGTTIVLEKVFTMVREPDRWRMIAEHIVGAQRRE